jgi:8-oxo-dGTP diphosphatase
MAFRFCPNCGARFAPPDADPFAPQKCERCGRIQYHTAAPCAGALIVKDGRVLLVKRGIEPFKGYWDIPGGFLAAGEHPRDGMLREVREETGLEVRVIRLLGVYMDRYGNDADSEYTLNHYYVVEPIGGMPRAADDAVELRWFAFNEIPKDQIAFEHERDVLRDLRDLFPNSLPSQESGRGG